MRIKNWEEYQHYKDRDPKWIKLYRRLLDDLEWHKLDPIAAKILIMLWLIASETEGELPDTQNIAFRLRLPEKTIESAISKLNHYLVRDDTDLVQVDTGIPKESILDIRVYKEDKSKSIYGEFVSLTEKQHQQLIARFGANDAEKRIERLNNYLGSTGKRYKSHYHTILNWASKDAPTIPDGPSPEKRAEMERCQYGNCEREGTNTMNNTKYCSKHLAMV